MLPPWFPHKPMNPRQIEIVACCLLLEAGCSLAPPSRRAESALVTESALPVQPPPPPFDSGLSAPGLGEPIYRSPKIGAIYLAAHQDAAGRLLGPQVMYQVVDPGGWNVSAVDRGAGFIPPENLEIPPGAGSALLVPAREVPPLAPTSPLFDAETAARVTITGLMKAGDRPEAEAMALKAGPGMTAIFDDQAGWLLIPSPSP